jgi:thioesterase domain-containing protein
MADKLGYLRKRIERKTQLPTEEHIADPYIIQPYPDKVALFLATKADRGNFFSHKIKLGLCPRAGWDEEIVPQLKIEQVPGDHFSMMEEPHVKVLGTKLKQYLQQFSIE